LLNVTIRSSSGGDKYEKVEAFEKEFKKKMGIKILSRDVNACKVLYRIEKRKDEKNGILKTEIRPSLLCKGLGEVAALEVEKHQPYKNMRDFVDKTNVGIGVIEALARGEYFKSQIKKNKNETDDAYVKRIVDDFRIIREDMKKLSIKKMESVDMFAGTFN
jgi:hypothetical protein